MKKLLTLALLALPLPALAGNWDVAPESTLTFNGTEQGVPFTGKFKAFTADITFDPADLAHAKADVTVQLAGIDTDSGERDETLAGPDWFNVGKHPTAKFETTAFRHLEGNKYEADGALTIGTISKPITLPFTLDIEGSKATMKGEVEIARADFALGKSMDDATAGKGAKVLVNITATKK